MKTFSLILIISLFITGCSNKECQPTIITNTETKYVDLPVKPDRPKINCDFEGEGNIPIKKLLECIILQKRVIEDITVER